MYRDLYLPKNGTADRYGCGAAGIGDDVGFATKPALAQKMIGRAVTAGVPFSWVAADEVYGGNPGLRSWLAEEGIVDVMGGARRQVIPAPAGGAPPGAPWVPRA